MIFYNKPNVLGFMVKEIKDEELENYTISKIYQQGNYVKYNFNGTYPLDIRLKDVLLFIERDVKQIVKDKFKNYKIDEVKFIKSIDELEIK